MSSQATPGSEVRVNSYTTGAQQGSAIASLDDGGWIVTWTSDGQDGDGNGIYQQHYDRNGNTVGGETEVNTSSTSAQDRADVTALADGGWLVTWSSLGQNSFLDGIHQRRYDSHGDAIGDETRVANDADGAPHDSSTAALADGGWIVTWTAPADGGNAVFQQRYAADGLKVEGEQQVSNFQEDSRGTSSVTALIGGGWVVTWTEAAPDSSFFRIFQQRFDAAGSGSGGGGIVDTYTTSSRDSAATAALSDGGWVVSWSLDGEDGNGYGVYQQRYDRDGQVLGTQTQVNTYSTGDQDAPGLTALADGGWVVVWASNGQDGDGYGIYQQRYHADGKPVGNETVVNTYTTHAQVDPTVCTVADGSWIVSWTSAGEDGNSDGVYQRHFAADIRGSGVADRLRGTGWDETLLGLAGDDRLNGKGGNDILIGGTGDDIYIVNSMGDDVQELPDQGMDTIRASVSFDLGNDTAVENLALSGKGKINATGNDGANVLTGNASVNVINGNGGDDTLTGGKGHDVVIGGYGADTFVFATRSGADTIKDFDAKGSDHDVIDLKGMKAIESFADLKAHHLEEAETSVFIDAGNGDTITIQEVKIGDLHAADFQF